MPNISELINQDKFKLPDMGDYYDEDMMEEFAQKISNAKPQDVMYYNEEPVSTQLGYHPEYNAFVLKAKPIIAKTDIKENGDGKKAEEMNDIDGDTVMYYIDSVEDGELPFTIDSVEYKSFKDYAFDKLNIQDFKENVFKIRSVAINAPEIPHYIMIPLKKDMLKDENIYKNFTMNEIKNCSDEIKYSLFKERKDGEKYPFVRSTMDNTWHEIIDENIAEKVKNSTEYEAMKSIEAAMGNSGILYVKAISKDDETLNDYDKTLPNPISGMYAKELMLELLNKMEDMRLIIDAKQLVYKSGYAGPYEVIGEGIQDDKSIWEMTKAFAKLAFGKDMYMYPGFNSFGQDAYRRFLGALYVKADIGNTGMPIWINASKYIASKLNGHMELKLGETPFDQSNGNGVSDAFKVWSYDNTNCKIVDAFLELTEKSRDDRRELQRQITGMDFDNYKDFTVMIGDCLFMVPPTSIRVVNQMESQRINLLRSKGSMTKTLPHTDRILQMTLFFNGNEGINGIKTTRKTPSGSEEEYYMNGLRSLISQFKFTPFLPIENEYINDDLGIEAVTLADIQIQTMPSYPKCLSVTLTLQQFNYRIYLTEMPIPDPTKGERYNKNMFATAIDFETMRYYYQRCIKSGEKIKDLDTLGNEYIEATMGSKTNLIPMKFEDQSISFNILDKNWLDKMMEVYQLADKKPVNQSSPISEDVKKWSTQFGMTCKNINDLLKNKLGKDSTFESYNINQTIIYWQNELTEYKKTPLLENISVANLDNNILGNTYIKFNIDFDGITMQEISNLMKVISKENDNYDLKSQLEKGGIILCIEPQNKNGVPVYKIDRNNSTNKAAFEMMEFFMYRTESLGDIDINDDGWDNFGQSSNSNTIINIKENAIDEETLLSAKFVPYPMENIIPQQFSIKMGNVLTATKLKTEEGYAPQYIGGQDTVIDFMFYTKSRDAVNALNLMQLQATDALVKYRKIIKCWPIRITSEMTRLCGINEVVIDSIDISTVPNQPGLFAISVKAISVDRTMRNRESLKKLDINNAGAINQHNAAEYVYNTYFDLSNVLSKTEVYPDLELPTIEEMEKAGFKFLRYSNNKVNRSYVDPDFYFVYSYAYSSQILRKSIIEYFKKNEESNSAAFNIKYDFLDNANEQIVTRKLSNEPNQVIESTFSNKDGREVYCNELKKRNSVMNEGKKEAAVAQNQNMKPTKEQLKEYKYIMDTESKLLTCNTPTWSVAKKIKCTLANAEAKNDYGVKVSKDKILKKIDEVLNSKIIDNNWGEAIGSDNYYNSLENALDDWIDKKEGSFAGVQEIFSCFSFDTTNGEFEKTMKGMYLSAAIAMSGSQEYSKESDKSVWEPKAYLYRGQINDTSSASEAYNNRYKMEFDKKEHNQYIPFSYIIDNMTQKRFFASSMEDAIKNGATFGPFQTKIYDKNFLLEFYSEDKTININTGFLDPYYNKNLNVKLSDNELNEYKEKIIKKPMFAIEAFNRNMLAWIKKLLLNDVFINTFDANRQSYYNDLESKLTEYQSALNEQHTLIKFSGMGLAGMAEQQAVREGRAVPQDGSKINQEIVKAMNWIKEYDYYLATGKLFLGIVLAVTDGGANIYKTIVNEDLGKLISMTRSCQRYIDLKTEGPMRKFRKLIKGLVATDITANETMESLGETAYSELDDAIEYNEEKLWLSASEDPTLWVMHSMYDMVVNNKRGRMARAFPTYYMMLIDEGRKIGYWKVHDNFYNVSAISEIEITKSRKMAADTAQITMTNMFSSYTSDDSDTKTDYNHNMRDVFNSIFSPRIYFEETEAKRMQQPNIDKVKLKPGARIHIKAGYSGDASSLPTLFNGVVSEVSQGELITLVAQGDGLELSNPDCFAGTTADDASQLANESSIVKWVENFFTAGDTPKGLIKNIFTTKSGVKGKLVNWISNGRFFNDNMFGMTHFGEIDYKDIHRNGEVMQNIYEGQGTMPWTKNEDDNEVKVGEVNTAKYYSIDEPPCFTVDLKGKSIWDVVNICAGSSIGYIAGIAPFGVRSTVFHGRPNYYYAYDYEIDKNGTIREKRKPYQQYHIVDSYSDIIANNIMADGKDIRTVAVPTYKGPGWLGDIVEKKIPTPMYIDWDIYPEFQKTITVNTGMTYNPSKLGFLLINKMVDEWSDEGGQKIAWRMGAKALKDSVKDMYKGEVSIIGDPSIKPLDKVFINDIYENMDGAFEAEAVVHRINSSEGFVTSVFADCISEVDDRYNQIANMWAGNVAIQTAIAKGVLVSTRKNFIKDVRPHMTTISRLVNGKIKDGGKLVSKLSSIAKSKDIVKYASLEKWNSKFLNMYGITQSEINLWNKLDDFKRFENALGKISGESIQDYLKSIKIIEKMNYSGEDIAKAIEDGIANGDVKEAEKEGLQKVANELKDKRITMNDNATAELKKSYESITNSLDSVTKSMTTDETNKLSKVKDLLKKGDASSISEVGEILNDVSSNADLINKAKIDVSKFDDLGKLIGKGAETIDEIKDTASTVKKSVKAIDTAKSFIFTPALGVTIATAVIETAIFYVLSKSVYNYLENVMANLNVLTVMPLKKNGIGYIAGLDGNKGSVMGMPSWDMQGPMENFIGWVFKPRGFVYDNLILGLFTTDNMRAIADKYKNKHNALSGNARQTDALDGMLEYVIQGEARKNSAYHSLKMVPRISNLKDVNAKNTFMKTQIKTLDDHRIESELVPITTNNRSFSEWLRSGRLKLANDIIPAKEKMGITYKSKAFGDTSVYAIRIDENFDIPFLRADASIILARILEKLDERLINKKIDGKKSEAIILKSCTVIGTNKWNSTGYLFRIQAVNFDFIKDILTEMIEENKENYVDKKECRLFTYRDAKGGTNAIDIFITPEDKYTIQGEK